MDKKQRLDVLDEIRKAFGAYNVFARNYAILKPLDFDQVKKSTICCAFCGYSETIAVGSESEGTIKTGTRSDEYYCQSCKNYSVYEQHWE